MLLLTDYRLAARALSRAPMLALTTLLVLGPALAAAGSGLALAWSAFVRELPYPEPDGIVAVEHTWEGFGVGGISTAMFHRYAEGAERLERLGLLSPSASILVTEGGARQVRSLFATLEALEILGARAARGRLFTPEEDRLGGPDAVVLAHGFWLRETGADPDVVGRTLEIDGRLHEVVGVLPADQDLPGRDPDLLLPAKPDPTEPHLINMSWTMAVGRLAGGVSHDAAQEELAAILSSAAAGTPDAATLAQNGIGPVVRPLREWEVGAARPFMLLLACSVVSLLVLGAASVANLVLGRAERHAGEVRLRRVLGASRGRVLGHLWAEASVLCLVAVIPGTLGAWALTSSLAAQSVLALPRAEAASLPLAAALAAAGCALVLAPLLTVLPLPHLTSVSAGSAARGNRSTAGGGLRRMLLGAQVAVSTILLASGWSLVQSATALSDLRLGFADEGLLTFRLVLPATRYAEVATAEDLHRRLAEGIRGLPGVESVGFGVGVPVADHGYSTVWIVEDRPVGGEEPTIDYRHVSEDYLSTLGVPLLAGRGFERADNEDDRPVVLVSASMAERYWGGPSAALGRRLRTRWDSVPVEVVGVVGNTADTRLGTDRPMMYQTLEVSPTDPYHLRFASFVVRAPSGPERLLPPIRELVARLDPSVPVVAVRTGREIVLDATARERLALRGIGASALASIVVVAAGLGGLVLLGVARRRREIGIRKAIGARDGRLRWILLIDVAVPGVVGLALGAAAVVLGATVPASLLYADSGPLPALAVAVPFLAGVILASGLAATARVARIEPAEALRSD